MKAKEIFEKYIDRCKWLTKDSDNVVRIWEHEPKLHISYCVIDHQIGCYKNSYMSDGVIVGVDVDEFDNLNWEGCIICVNDLVEEETFTREDVINLCIHTFGTDEVYQDMVAKFANKMLDEFKQTR